MRCHKRVRPRRPQGIRARTHGVRTRRRAGVTGAVTAYPPDEHILRDLRFTFEHDGEGRSSRAWMPIVPEACNDAGHERAGVLAQNAVAFYRLPA